MIQPTSAFIPAAHLFPVAFKVPEQEGAESVAFSAWCMFVPRVGERVVGPDGTAWSVAEVAYAPSDTRPEAHYILRPTVTVQRLP